MDLFNVRGNYDGLLKEILENVLLMGSMVEENVHASIRALVHRDHTAARQVYEFDQNINQKRYEIEDNYVTLIVTQQPMASDARFLIAVLEISTELERIGDYAKGIAKITVLMGEEEVEYALQAYLSQMEETGLRMLRAALEAFYRRDSQAAQKIPSEDDSVDSLYNKIYRKVIENNIANRANFTKSSYILWAAHNLERLADRVANICERTIYLVSGELKELSPDEDFS